MVIRNVAPALARATGNMRLATAVALTLLAAGCATPYKANGLGGGFVDERIDDQTYSVAFHGNGLAKRDRVWNFWFYRCAELTREKGYSAFAVTPGSPPAKTSDNGSPWVPVKGGGYVPHYYYMPGGTVTMWNARGVVTMFSVPYPQDALGHLFSVETVLTALKPYIDDPEHVIAPPRDMLLRAALIPKPLGRGS